MSQENVEIMRRAYAAFSEGNLGPVLEALDVDLEWNASDVFFDQPRTYPRSAGPGRSSFFLNWRRSSTNTGRCRSNSSTSETESSP